MTDLDGAIERFIDAQRSTFAAARAELAAGRKRSHWMWFVFPQVAGLGRSAMAQRYAIRSLSEARAYLSHPVLGARLQECAALLLELEGLSAYDVFGSPDDLKLRSSMTLFASVQGPDSVFQRVLDRYYLGVPDAATLTILATWSGTAGST